MKCSLHVSENANFESSFTPRSFIVSVRAIEWSSRSRGVSREQRDGQTDVNNLIVVFRNFTNAPEKSINSLCKTEHKQGSYTVKFNVIKCN
jgi:hypothetical protein